MRIGLPHCGGARWGSSRGCPFWGGNLTVRLDVRCWQHEAFSDLRGYTGGKPLAVQDVTLAQAGSELASIGGAAASL